MKNKVIIALLGVAAGVINGFFGAGGGTVAVPMLRRAGLSEKEAHATSIAVILAVTLVSAAFYVIKGNASIRDSIEFAAFGVFGAWLGAVLLKKIKAQSLKRIFGVIIVIASVRMLLR